MDAEEEDRILGSNPTGKAYRMRKPMLFLLGLGVALFVSAPISAKDKNWSDHKGNIPFIVGWEKGQAEAKFSGKPIMAFFTTTW